MVITRFAPSPTGGLHIGSIRTILFNWLYAKHCNGKFLLRIEDTDVERSKQEYVQDICDSMNWLGLNWEGEIVFQLKNIKRHQEVAHDLLAQGKAYKCFCTQEELAAMRELAVKEGRTPRYERKCRCMSSEEIAIKGEMPFVVRLKSPTVGRTAFRDLIQGECGIDNEHLDDMVLLRSDGVPTYMLAVVVDDHDMNITHVIRGSEHLNNAYRQIQIYKTCEWQVPEFAHVSLIHGEDGAKLSKRHGATNLSEYIQMGFLKEAILNYLIHLGWNKSEEEILSIDECIKLFDITDVRSSPARFSMHKLLNVNSIYMRAKENHVLLQDLQNFAGKDKYDEAGWMRVLNGMDELKSRTRTLLELENMSAIYGYGADYFGSKINESDDVKKLFKMLIEDACTGKIPATIEEIMVWMNGRIAECGKTLKEVAPDIRFALTKEKVAPSIFELIKVLGAKIVASRLEGSIS